MNSQSVRWALWSSAAVAGIAALAVVIYFATRTHPQSNDVVMQQIEDSVRPAATQMTNLQHRLVIYDMTLAMRVERGALNSADVQPALLQRARELQARDLGDAPLIVEQAQEAASYFQFVDNRIVASSAWSTDKPAATYRAIAQIRMKLARQNYDMALQRGLPPSLALDEASAALALSNGTVVGVTQRTAFDRAHDEIVALVRDYAQDKVQPPASHVADNNGAVADAVDSSLATSGDRGTPASVTRGSSLRPGDPVQVAANGVPSTSALTPGTNDHAANAAVDSGTGSLGLAALAQRISGNWFVRGGTGKVCHIESRGGGNLRVTSAHGVVGNGRMLDATSFVVTFPIAFGPPLKATLANAGTIVWPSGGTWTRKPLSDPGNRAPAGN